MPYDFYTPLYCEQKITRSGYDYIFVSPHLDDVVLSCSGTLCALKEHYNVLVITLFAKDPRPPFSPLAQSFHRLWKVSDTVPYAQRKEEERQAMALLGVDYAWLNWPEILYRTPHLASANEICDPAVNPEHDNIFSQICHWLMDLSSTFSTAQFIIPLAIGAHRDHVVIRHVASRVIDSHALIFYEDFPYVAFQAQEIQPLVRSYGLIGFSLDISRFLEQRIQATHQYQSQLDMLCHPPKRIEDLIRHATEKKMAQDRSISVEKYWMTSQEQLPLSFEESVAFKGS